MAEPVTNNPIASEVVDRIAALKRERVNFDTLWREVAERIHPEERRQFESSLKDTEQGQDEFNRRFDSTASTALNRFSAIMDSFLTPRQSMWHRLQVDNPELQKDRQVRLWFDEATRILFKFRYAPKANFASQNNRIFDSVGMFGNGPMFIDALSGERGLRYKACPLGQIYFAENHQGIVDTVFRSFPMTARQIVQAFPEGVPDSVMKKARTANASQDKMEVIHCVKPREDVDRDRADFRGMPFASYYVLEDGKFLLRENGFISMPYAISRYKVASGESYARSPATDVLPSIKTVNEQKKTLLKQAHRTVDPVLLGHDDGDISGFSMIPGAYNAGGVSKEGRPLIHTLPVGRLDVSRDMMEDERNDIKDAFLVTLFQILVESPNMTATEVIERIREKGILLAPEFGRQESEYLGPLIEREMNLLLFQGLLPPLPPILLEAQGEYTIVYDSPFSRTQRAEEAAGLLRTYDFSLNVAERTQDMSVLDYFDLDVIIPEMAHIQGMPERFLRDPAQIIEIREARAQAQEAERAARLAPGAAALAKAGAVVEEKAPGLAAAAAAEA